MPSLAAYGNIDYIVVIHTFLLLSPLNVFCMFETYQSIGMVACSQHVPRSQHELSSGLDQLAPFWRVHMFIHEAPPNRVIVLKMCIDSGAPQLRGRLTRCARTVHDVQDHTQAA